MTDTLGSYKVGPIGVTILTYCVIKSLYGYFRALHVPPMSSSSSRMPAFSISFGSTNNFSLSFVEPIIYVSLFVEDTLNLNFWCRLVKISWSLKLEE